MQRIKIHRAIPDKALVPALTLISAMLFGAAGPTVASDEPSQPLIAEVDAGVITPAALDQDPALGVLVSHQATQLPVAVFLSELAKKSNLDLLVAPDAIPENYRVTVSIRDMSLASVLKSLSLLYGVRWQKTADRQYRMLGNKDDALQKSLLRVGDPYFYRLRYRLSYNYPVEKQRKVDLAAAILASLDRNALLSPGGVSFASVPGELQAAARRELQTYAAECLLRERRLMDAAAAHKLSLYFGPTPIGIPDLEGSFSMSDLGPRFSVRTESGQVAAFVFDPLYRLIVPPHNQGEP